MTTSSTTEAWDIVPTDFPRDGTQQEQLHFMLGYGILAPSAYNAQPWLFRVSDDHIEVYADRSRALPIIDPLDRQLLMACGAAAINIAIAMRHFGYAAETNLFPDPEPDGPVVRMRIGQTITPSKIDEELFTAIPSRHTNRKPFAERPIGYQIANDLIAAAESEGAWLVRLQPEGKNAAADLIAQGDKIQFADRRFRREIAAWLVSNRSNRRDGLPGHTKGFGDLMSMGAPVLVRTFDRGNEIAAKERELASGSPLLAVMGTEQDDERSWLQCGMAMQRVLLLACVHGISASFLNQPLEVDELRPKFAALTSEMGQKGWPQLVLRMGFGPSVRPTPRRPVGDVLIYEDSEH